MNKSAPLQTFSLQPFHIKRPVKISWNFPSLENHEPSDFMQSKSLKSLYINADDILQKNGLHVEKIPATQEEFLTWLAFYREKTLEYGYDAMANEQTLDEKHQEHKEVEILKILKGDELVSSAIIVKAPTDKGTRASMAFSASQRFPLSSKSNSSIGYLLNIFFFKFMKEENLPIITGGAARNDFTVLHNLGYLEYKLRIGYIPVKREATDISDEAYIDENGESIFFGEKNGVFSLFYLLPNGQEPKQNLHTLHLPETIVLEMIHY